MKTPGDYPRVFPCLALPCLALPCLALPCLALPCLALPCLALPCLALPCPALPPLSLCLAPLLQPSRDRGVTIPRHRSRPGWGDKNRGSQASPVLPSANIFNFD